MASESAPQMRCLLACATEMELTAFISRLPGADKVCLAPGGDRDKSPAYGPDSRPDSGAHSRQDGERKREGQGAVSLPRLELPSGLALDLMICGVGPVAPALALGRVLGWHMGRSMGPALAAQEETAYAGLINIGLAGSYDPAAAPVGSLVLASGECLPEYGVWPDAGEIIQGSEGGAGAPGPLSLPQTLLGGREVFSSLDLDPDLALGRMGLDCHGDSRQNAPRRGIFATLAGVSGTPGRARRMAALTGALVENMEGFALALGAAQHGLPFLEARVLSNEAGFRPPRTWNLPLALEGLAGAGTMLFSPWL